MAINERLVHTASAAAAGTGNQEEGLILHLDANDVDSYDGDGDVWYDISNYEYTPATNVSEHFNTVTYTGTGTTNPITVGFQPDLIWIKNRDQTDSHAIVDSVRGITSPAPYLASNETNAEQTSTNMPTSVQSDGFTITGSGGRTNTNGEDYVAWCFKAGGAAVSNTDGTITSQVSANNDLGFSIVKYTGNLSAGTTDTGQSVGHGMNVPPELIIFKRTDSTSDWNVFSNQLDNWTTRLLLNDAVAKNNLYSSYPIANPTSSVFYTNYLSAVNVNGATHIAYCFTSKRGVSKVGSYVGTGAAGNKVYTGFEPAFVMVKRTDAAQSWGIYDNKRVGTSETPQLLANVANAEAEEGLYFERDGFRLDGSETIFNGSGGTYIYYAVAKNTNETSLIPNTDLELHLDPTSYSGSGTTWTADVGSDATISGAAYDQELGNWFDFDGSNDYVEVSTIPSGIQNDTILTGEAWIYPKTATANSIISFRGSTNTSIKFFLAANSSGQLYLVSSSTSTFLSFGTTASNVVPTNKWTHVAATINYSTKAYTIYANGEEVSSGTQGSIRGATTFNATNFYVGTNLVGVQHSNLRIGQVRLYSSALTQDQIRQNYNFTKPNYPNGFDGTISNTAWNSSGYFDFNGSSSKIELPDVPTFDKDSEIKAVSAWVKLDTTTSRVFPLSISSTSNSNDYWYFGWLADLGKIYVATRDGGSANQSFATATVTANTNWRHIFCQVTDTDREIYLDGVKQTVSHTKAGTGTNTSWISYPSYATNAKGTVGVLRLASPSYSNGFISDVKAYNKILTQAEITAEYDKGQFGDN